MHFLQGESDCICGHRVLWLSRVEGVPCVHFSINHWSGQPKLSTERNTPLTCVLSPSHTQTALLFFPSGVALTHTCSQLLTHTRTQICILRRGFHYTRITKRNVLIKLCRQLQNAKRENGNDVVHGALKKNTSRGLCMCV